MHPSMYTECSYVLSVLFDTLLFDLLSHTPRIASEQSLSGLQLTRFSASDLSIASETIMVILQPESNSPDSLNSSPDCLKQLPRQSKQHDTEHKRYPGVSRSLQSL